eukprot:scaffold374710_cov46-Prasinocladus_malaysianus.AAC.1
MPFAQNFDFADVSTGDTLHVHVKDKDRLKSDNLGEVFIPVHDIMKHCKADPDGRWTQEWNLAGVSSGSIKLSLYWDAGSFAAGAHALNSSVRELRRNKCLRPLDPTQRLLAVALDLPHWRLYGGIAWA